MKLVIASDHGGFELKNKIYNYLKEKNFDIVDFGTNNDSSCDYPYYAQKAAHAILNNEFDKGILICGTGLGMQISANRFKGIRAVCISDTYSARMSRLHNNANILTLGGRVLGVDLAKDIVDIWLNTNFEGARHQKRLDMIENIEE